MTHEEIEKIALRVAEIVSGQYTKTDYLFPVTQEAVRQAFQEMEARK